MSHSPLFSIIVVDYDKSVTRDEFARKMKCISAQTCKDFEVLIYHDGPKPSSYDDDINGLEIHPDTKFHITDKRENDWGHSNRDRGIRAARGEWIIHTNADNVFYPDLIENLKAKIDSPMDAAPIVKITRFPIIIKSIVRRFDKYLGTNFQKVEI
ncbi:MAG: glycosyltransferase family 2 protein [Marinosulfonomonas sp.]|nr:glycosyltransferase family 2 protein [Marinosulfonomonas sp.]